MSPDIRDALQEIQNESEWAYDLIKFELDRLQTKNTELEANLKCSNEQNDLLIEGMQELEKEVAGLREIVEVYEIDNHWRENVKACRESGMNRITLSVPVDKYEQLGKSLADYKGGES